MPPVQPTSRRMDATHSKYLLLLKDFHPLAAAGEGDHTETSSARRRAVAILEESFLKAEYGEPRGHMEYQSSHLAEMWLAYIVSGARILPAGVDIGKTWGFPGEMIKSACAKAEMTLSPLSQEILKDLGEGWRPALGSPLDLDPGGGRSRKGYRKWAQGEKCDSDREGLALAAINIVLQQERTDGSTLWYVENNELDLVSFSVCRMARKYPISSGLVTDIRHDFPRRRTEFEGVDGKQVVSIWSEDGGWVTLPGRVGDLLPKSPLRLTWDDSLMLPQMCNGHKENWAKAKVLAVKADVLGALSDVEWPPNLVCLSFGPLFDQALTGVTFPRTIKVMSFEGGSGAGFCGNLTDVNLPSTLTKFSIDCFFNDPIKGVAWPDTIETMHLGGGLNQEIEGVSWPASLRVLTFGPWFNQFLTGSSWPERLCTIRTGASFRKSLHGVSLPPALQSLVIGGSFNSSLSGVTFPPSLVDLSLGASFDSPLGPDVSWAGVTRLSFALHFNRRIKDVCWPRALQILKFGDSFSETLEGAAWPGTLVELEVGRGYDVIAVHTDWPESLQTLTLGGDFNGELVCVRNGKLAGFRWPPRLKSLVLGEKFNKGVSLVGWPETLRELRFGGSFCQPLSDVRWPAGATELRFDGMDAGDNFARVRSWPDSIKRVRFRNEVVTSWRELRFRGGS